ncbi:hypothetical protein K469DRAFT_39209 [Zopfia rhizophila CBS 207.26]|uniref:Uncharacterized protein n=1 Tax=Zopfia rhizophila CBS 207.26 TaxID=1314779 RepID=A0A6A6DCF8_9PEZI|nr:hypothetical protein K469DRAFT_39209 [Zopfia rhizophila CBS 207.26]
MMHVRKQSFPHTAEASRDPKLTRTLVCCCYCRSISTDLTFCMRITRITKSRYRTCVGAVPIANGECEMIISTISLERCKESIISHDGIECFVKITRIVSSANDTQEDLGGQSLPPTLTDCIHLLQRLSHVRRAWWRESIVEGATSNLRRRARHYLMG